MERVPLKRKILSENDRIAESLRARFHENGVFSLNLLGSPGAGKTSLLERTLAGLPNSTRVAVLTGDIQTDNDARRLSRFGFPTRQITTGGACHLDARMVERALQAWDLESLDLLLIENVGNLVCPAGYDLGEAVKVVVLSVPEGDDKPLKYPAIFWRAEGLVINKLDLLPYVPFDLAAARENAARVHPGIVIHEVSCHTCQGMGAWLDWIASRRGLVERSVSRT